MGLVGSAAEERSQLRASPFDRRKCLVAHGLDPEALALELRNVLLVGLRRVREKRHVVAYRELSRKVVHARRPAPPRGIREPSTDDEYAHAHGAKTRRARRRRPRPTIRGWRSRFESDRTGDRARRSCGRPATTSSSSSARRKPCATPGSTSS